MSIEYAPLGFVGILTPQSNSTVEPEFGILLPKGTGLLTARLVSKQTTLENRLLAYFDQLTQSAAQFAEAPLRSLGVACTGSSYLVGREREDALFDELKHRTGVHVTSSALSVVDALQTLNAKRIGLVSPYPDSLLRHSIAYWESRDFKVDAVAQVVLHDVDRLRSGQTNPIYTIGSNSVKDAIDKLSSKSVDAIVLLGTGMPSLKSILQVPHLNGAPVISCTLALAWRCFTALKGEELTSESLHLWIEGSHWRKRFENWFEETAGTT